MSPFRKGFFSKISILGALWIMSCTRSPQEERLQAAKERLELLLVEFSHIHSSQDLSHSFIKLQTLFESIAELLLDTEEQEPLQDPYMQEINERVKKEMGRIYRLEGGREWIEKSQEKALEKIETHLKRLQKKRLQHLS